MDEKKHICPVCQKAFSKKYNLTRHIQSGTCQKPSGVQCPVCTISYKNKRDLAEHIKKDHPSQATHMVPDHKCPNCGRMFSSESHLNIHIKNGPCAKPKHQCHICGKGYTVNKNLLRHIRKMHPDQAPAKKPHKLADVQGYHCCGETFANGREYRTHKDGVHVRKPTMDLPSFSCQKCDAKFIRKAELIQHQKSHRVQESDSDSEEEQPRCFKCPFKSCHERFQDRSALHKHKWTHRPPVEQDGELCNNSWCDICDKWFWHEEELRNHRMDEHGESGGSKTYFQCPYIGCNGTFDSRQDQEQHIQDHGPLEEEEEPEEETVSYGLIADELLDNTEVLLDTTSAKVLYSKVGEPIVDQAGQKKFKTVRTRQSFQLTPKALRLCEQGLSLEVMSKIIDSMFKKIVQKGGYIQIKLISDSLDSPIVMPLIHVKMFDPLVLLNYIESVMSSKDRLMLDETLTFDVIHVEDMQGAGRQMNATLLDSYLKRRTGIFDAKNWDYRCLGICLAASIMIARTPNFKKAKFYKDPLNCAKLKELTTELYLRAGVDEDKECGEAELHKFQTVFNDKQIVVLDENLEHQFTGQPTRNEGDQLFLFLFDKHYYLIWDLHAFIGFHKRFCPRCVTVYDYRSRHLCEDVCPQCLRPNCEAMENPDTIIVCERCSITFKNFQCYLAHAGSQKVCMHIRYRCQKCLCIRYVDGRHDCDKKPKCPHCFEEVDLSEHLCEVQVPSEKTRLGSKTFNVVYFDVEMAVGDGRKLNPYLVCWAVNCDKCINIETDNCDVCGARYRLFYGWDCAKKFCDWLATNKRIEKHRTILTAHNSSKFDAYFLYEYAAATGTRPNLNFRANDLLSMTWKKIQLKDSLQFMKCSLDKLPSILGLGRENEKGFFAMRLANDYPTLDYVGKIPTPYYFMVDQMNDEKRERFFKWYTPLERNPYYVYNLKLEAIKYCRMDVKILEAAWKKFRSSCLELTNGQVDPLIGRYFTLASYSAAIYKTLYMKKPIGIVPYRGYRNPKRTSQSWQGSAYLDFLNDQRAKEGKEPLVCANNSTREVAVGPYNVDGYCRLTDEIYEVLGCYWHSHTNNPDSCYWGLRKAVHPTRKPLTYEDVNLETIMRLRRLEETGKTVHRIWICEIEKQMKENPLLSAFMKDEEMLLRYKQPLEPSTAVFGGRVEAFKMRMILTTEQIMAGYTIEYVDFCSLYPFVQWYFKFTTNPHPTVIVSRRELNGIVENLAEFLADNYGLCYCKVLPPERLNFAVLPTRIRGKTVFCLCRTCAEEDWTEGCEHGDNERALEGVYTFYELLKAVQRGYEVLHVHEIWNYGPEMKKIMADYVTNMISLKTRHSEVPSEMTVQECCDLWNGHVPGMNLQPEDFSLSPAMRLSAKILMNSLWGKFCERASRTYTCLIDGWQSLKRKMDDREIVVSRIEQISGRSLVISYQKKQPFLTETSMYNPVLGSYVTAYARITLLEKCLEVVGERACYVDTDSLCYLSIPGAPEPERGVVLGQLANELKSDEFGSCFQCVAPKSWRLEVCKRTSDAPIIWHPSRTIIKSKGLHLEALGSSIRRAINDRKLWNDLIDMRLVEADQTTPQHSMAEFYRSLERYRVPDELIKPCLESFKTQKWIKDRADKKAPGLIVPQPKLGRDRFTGWLKEERFAKKMIRLRHDKSVLVNTEPAWPQNAGATKPYGFRLTPGSAGGLGRRAGPHQPRPGLRDLAPPLPGL